MTERSEIDGLVAYLRRGVLTVFFILDVSGSMKGERLDALNAAIRGALPALGRKESESAEIRVSVLEFSSSARWSTPVPEPVSACRYEDISRTGGGTNYGAAFRALRERFNSFPGAGRAYDPFVLLLVDGRPSDPLLYGEELARLEENPWFRRAVKAGIAIEEGAASPECRKALADFTGGEASVFALKNIQLLGGQVQIAVLNGIDTLLERGPSAAGEDIPSFIPPPAEISIPEIPGLDAIDWENEFPRAER